MADRAYFAGRWAAQEARRAGQARAEDAQYHGQVKPRWQSGSEAVDTDQRAKADAGARGVAPLPDAASSPPLYALVALCRAAGLPEPIPEYKFHPLRKWRADHCWPIHKLIVEIDGGLFVQGRHSRGAGQLKDMEKLNAAAMLGYRVLRYSPSQIERECLRDLRIMLA